MDRRSFVKAAGGALGAAVGMLTAKRGIGLPGAERGVAGQQVAEIPMLTGSDATLVQRDGNSGVSFGEMMLVSGPDPGTYVYVEFGSDGSAVVIPPGRASVSQNVIVSGLAIPLSEFPEFDPAHGIVTIYERHGNLLPPEEWTVPMIRAHYLYALGQRTPDVPIDGNHLAYRFMPRVLDEKFGGVLLNGYGAFHIDESYDGPNGWVVQLELGANGQPITHDDGDRIMLRKRILTGDVTHWTDGAPFSPGTYTALLLP